MNSCYFNMNFRELMGNYFIIQAIWKLRPWITVVIYVHSWSRARVGMSKTEKHRNAGRPLFAGSIHPILYAEVLRGESQFKKAGGCRSHRQRRKSSESSARKKKLQSGEKTTAQLSNKEHKGKDTLCFPEFFSLSPQSQNRTGPPGWSNVLDYSKVRALSRLYEEWEIGQSIPPFCLTQRHQLFHNHRK